MHRGVCLRSRMNADVDLLSLLCFRTRCSMLSCPQLLLVKLPNVLGIDPRAFDPATYTMEQVEEKAPAPSRSTSSGAAKVKSEKREEKRRAKKDKDAMDIDDDDEDVDEKEKEAEEEENEQVKMEDRPEDAPEVRVKLSVENIIRWRRRKDEAGNIIVSENNTESASRSCASCGPLWHC
jgi:hypothetical protein